MCSFDKVPGEKIVVTNRHLCHRDFFEQIAYLCTLPIDRIILREKDLSEAEYEKIARRVSSICKENGIACTLHTFYPVAQRFGCEQIHLPFSLFVEMMGTQKEVMSSFSCIGTSVHSLEDALLAEQLGATYVTAGHIYSTQCKPDLAPRGIDFLKEICSAVSIPVYAIGGITPQNTQEVVKAGALGACMMSYYMRL